MKGVFIVCLLACLIGGAAGLGGLLGNKNGLGLGGLLGNENGLVDLLFIDNQAENCGELGCFNTEDDFDDPIRRPVNRAPESREFIGTQFLMYMRLRAYTPMEVKAGDLQSFRNARFSNDKRTVFLIHDFIENSNATWIELMKKDLLIKRNYNIIVVNWGLGSGLPYSQAAANARLVGAEVANIIMYLKINTNFAPRFMHIIGKGIGAHIAGYAGLIVNQKTASVNDKIGRITGLDPAGPYFGGMAESVRLDPSDAIFVDVIHTDGDSVLNAAIGRGGYGIGQPCGTVDFYPNGGEDQPGCDALNSGRDLLQQGVQTGIEQYLSCDHNRAADYFRESINTCTLRAYPCTSMDDFRNGHCMRCDDEICGIMGFDAARVRPEAGKTMVKQHLYTNEHKFFCRNHHQILITIGDNRGSKSQYGILEVDFIDDLGETHLFEIFDGAFTMEPGNTYSGLAVTNPDLITIDAIDINWQCRDNLGGLNLCLLNGNKDLFIERIEVNTGETGERGIFCGPTTKLREREMRRYFKSPNGRC